MRFHGFVVASVVASTIAARMGNGGVHVVIITTARLEYRNNMGDSGLVTVSNGGMPYNQSHGREHRHRDLDNDPWSARAIAQWIGSRFRNFQVLWCSSSSAQALHRCLYDTVTPDVLIVDMALDGISGSAVCARIRRRSDIGIIGITAYDPSRYITEMKNAGAQALLSKDRIPGELARCIVAVASGQTPQPECFRSVASARRIVAESDERHAVRDSLSARAPSTTAVPAGRQYQGDSAADTRFRALGFHVCR